MKIALLVNSCCHHGQLHVRRSVSRRLFRYILCDATQAKVEDNRKRKAAFNERAAHRRSGAQKHFKKGKKPYHREDTPYLFPGAPV